jgi:hypothetical protein
VRRHKRGQPRLDLAERLLSLGDETDDRVRLVVSGDESLAEVVKLATETLGTLGERGISVLLAWARSARCRRISRSVSTMSSSRRTCSVIQSVTAVST